jgi:copper resistance protein B
MNITKLLSKHVIGASILFVSGQVFAHDHSQMQMNHQDHLLIKSSVMHEPPSHADHSAEHGGQIYQSSEFTTKWLNDKSGNGAWQTQLESRIGTDENKLFIQLNAEKAESEQTSYDTKFMYSRAVKDFWDFQAGVRYVYTPENKEEKNQTYGAVGINGLAPYFFDTDIYMYVGKDDQLLFSLESDRDVLLTQKLILKPYLDLEVVANDHSKYAKKTGVSHASLGVETRYEITKKIMPYIDVSYGYEKGDKATAWQDRTDSEKGWLYGAGIQFNF